MPVYWTGLIIMLIFAEWLEWLPATGRNGLAHLVMPALTLGLWGAGDIARMTRANVVEVLAESYVRTAWAKGLSEQAVIVKHVLKNALLPVVTIIGLQLGAFLSGTVVTETVFAYPGVGRFMVNSIRYRDFPMVQGGALLISTTLVSINLLVDILYTYIDPRIRRV
jgi:peptide/nickel transport system permease protein